MARALQDRVSGHGGDSPAPSCYPIAGVWLISEPATARSLSHCEPSSRAACVQRASQEISCCTLTFGGSSVRSVSPTYTGLNISDSLKYKSSFTSFDTLPWRKFHFIITFGHAVLFFSSDSSWSCAYSSKSQLSDISILIGSNQMPACVSSFHLLSQ